MLPVAARVPRAASVIFWYSRQPPTSTSTGFTFSSDEAEAAYRQALDIYLEFGDRYSAASTYHGLGVVVQEQGRFAEAEAGYRQALEIWRESDPRQASMTTSRLGLLFAAVGRHDDAAAALLDAALTWHQVTGNWDAGDLTNLKRERAIIGSDAFEQFVAAKIPEDLRTSLVSGVDAAEDPQSDDGL